MKVAIVRVSQRAGMLKSVYVYETRSDGWIRAGVDRDASWRSCWYAPKNIVQTIEVDKPKYRNYDYNDILPGTLVEYWSCQQGMVISRKGAKYTILPLGASKPVLVDWEQVVPVLVSEETHATG